MLKKLNAEELYLKFMEELEEVVNGSLSGATQLASQVTVVQDYLKILKEFVLDNSLQVFEEIEFFKLVKPKFYQWIIYYVELHGIVFSRPFSEGDELYNYYVAQLGFFNRFFRQNEFLYQYYKIGAVELDDLYFVRGAKMPTSFPLEIPEVDPTFCSNMDYLFAKFMAYERLQEYVLFEIRKLAAKSDVQVGVSESPLTWTGDKTNLVEIIYGLFYTGQINRGNASVADIIKWMEVNLNIDLSRCYKNFIDIKNRKRDSPTKFLDKMKAFILQRIDEDNTYKPNRGAKLIGEANDK